jgi:hypothetical protein
MQVSGNALFRLVHTMGINKCIVEEATPGSVLAVSVI